MLELGRRAKATAHRRTATAPRTSRAGRPMRAAPDIRRLLLLPGRPSELPVRCVEVVLGLPEVLVGRSKLVTWWAKLVGTEVVAGRAKLLVGLLEPLTVRPIKLLVSKLVPLVLWPVAHRASKVVATVRTTEGPAFSW